MALSFADLEGLWIQAGGNSAVAPVAAAIALAESGGNPTAHNAKPPDDSYGLWQINMLGSLGPARRQQYGITSNTQLYDPLTNARAAVKISSGGSSFRAWSTYTNGAYQKYVSGNVPPNLGAGGAGSPDATTASFESSVMTDVYQLFNVVANSVVFLGALLGGAVLLAAGFYMLFKGTDVTGLGAATSAIRVVGGPAARAVVK